MRISIDWHGESPSEYLRYIGEFFETRNELETALAFFRAACDLDCFNAAATVQTACVAEKLKMYVTAGDFYERAHSLLPKHASVFYNAARMYHRLGNRTRTYNHASSAFALDPLNVGALQLVLRVANEEGNHWRTLELTEPPLPGDVNVPQVRIYRSIALAKLGRLDEATQIFEKLPQSARVRHRALHQELEQLISANRGHDSSSPGETTP